MVSSPRLLEFRWSPEIGDPTVMGWLTVVAYFIVAGLCLRAFMLEVQEASSSARERGPNRRAGLWLLLAVGMGLLAINKQLDLQTLMTEIGRQIMLRGGWYEHKRLVQVVVIVTILVIAFVAVAALWWAMRGQLADFRVALTGVVLLLGFIVIRATSFHEMDAFIGFVGDDIRMNWVLELGGIGVVGFGAARRWWRAFSRAR